MTNAWETGVRIVSPLGMFLVEGSALAVFSAFMLLLAIVYVSVRMLSVRIGVVLLLLSIAFSALPWLGLGSGTFMHPAADRPLPIIKLDPPLALRGLLKFMYMIAEFPLHLATLAPYVTHVVYFAGEGSGSARPFFVFVFWLGISIAIGTSLLFQTHAQKHWSSQER